MSGSEYKGQIKKQKRVLRTSDIVRFLWPIGCAIAGLAWSAILFPAQTIPQIIGVCLGWIIGFKSAAAAVKARSLSRARR